MRKGLSRIKHGIIPILALALMLLPYSAYADMGGYMSNIISNIGNLAPKSYHSQQRGYFVGGTMRIPPQGVTIQPFSITMPQLSNDSCGGINAMMGGFSYLNFKYLVQKLQGIIQAAPALAFEIAIKVLSEKLGNVMQDLEGVTNAINGLNFNSCSATNGIVTKAANWITSAMKSSSEESVHSQLNGGSDWFGNAITSSVDNVGAAITKLWTDIKDGNWSSNGQKLSNKQKEDIMGIPSEGFLNSIADQLGGLPSDFIDVMRYYIGDVVPVNNSVTGTPTPIGNIVPGPGSGDPEQFIKDLAEGNECSITYNELVGSRDPIGKCGKVSSNLEVTVLATLNNIYNDLLTNQPINQKDVNLIEISQIPIYRFMTNAAILGGGYGPVLAEQLAKPIAINIAAVMASRFLTAIRIAAANASKLEKIKSNPATIKTINQYIQNIANFQWHVYQAYNNSLKDAVAIYGNFMNEYNQMQAEVNRQERQLQFEENLRFQKAVGG